MRIRLPLLTGLAVAAALAATAGVVRAQSAAQSAAPSAPPVEAEEPPPPAPTATQPTPPAPVVAETPATDESKPKAVVSETPAQPERRVRAVAAILQALDKVTAETLRFEAPVGQPIRYKSLVVTVKACETQAPDEAAPEAAAYLTIDSQPKPVAGRPPVAARQVFKGWMFASSPGLNPLQHPVYDVWVIACRTAAPSASPPKP